MIMFSLPKPTRKERILAWIQGTIVVCVLLAIVFGGWVMYAIERLKGVL